MVEPFPFVSDVSLHPLFLVFLGFTVGVVGGFVGVGGGYMVTPALIVFGVPGYIASGSDLVHMLGKATAATIRHRQLGNVAIWVGLLLTAGTVFGVEAGIRILNRCKAVGVSSEAVLAGSLGLLLVLGIYSQWETAKARRILAQCAAEGKPVPREIKLTNIDERLKRIHLPPRVIIGGGIGLDHSIWIVIGIGFVTGLVSGFLGVGGGFLRIFMLVYLLGIPTLLAVGTDLFSIVIAGLYGGIRHAMSGNVDFAIALWMLFGAVIGAQVGALATRYVRGTSVRMVLSYSILLAAVGAALQLGGVLMENAPLQKASQIVTIGQLFVLVGAILALVVLSIMVRHGKLALNRFARTLVLSREDE
jgi:uncharacterized membrane protein YfcA